MSAQAKTVALFRRCGCVVHVFSDRKRAKVPGFCDFIALHHSFEAPLAWEEKEGKDRVRPKQFVFEENWRWGNGWYGRGDYDDAYKFLVRRGLIARVAA